MTEQTADRYMTLNGATARVDTVLNGGKLAASFKDGAVKNVAVGHPVTVDGAEMVVSATYPARKGHVGVTAAPKDWTPQPVILAL